MKKKKLIRRCLVFLILLFLCLLPLIAAFLCGSNKQAETEQKGAAAVTEGKNQYVSLGEFKLTAYCSCKQCCGKSDGITASGAKVKEGVTIAADTEIFPFGTVISINGNEYTVQDRGGGVKGNHIDIYFDSHAEALEFGVQNTELFRKDEGEMPIITNDPIADFHRWDAEQCEKVEKLPRCSECDNPIQEEFCYEINDELICEKCLNDNHRKRVEDYT